MIQKQKLFDFPQGQDVNGVIFEIEKNQSVSVSSDVYIALERRLFF
jgi:hypothetical protein